MTYLEHRTASEEEQVADDDSEALPVVEPHKEEVEEHKVHKCRTEYYVAIG